MHRTGSSRWKHGGSSRKRDRSTSVLAVRAARSDANVTQAPSSRRNATRNCSTLCFPAAAVKKIHPSRLQRQERVLLEYGLCVIACSRVRVGRSGAKSLVIRTSRPCSWIHGPSAERVVVAAFSLIHSVHCPRSPLSARTAGLYTTTRTEAE